MGFGNLSVGEVVVLLVIGLLVFGARGLPEAGKAVGKGLRQFKRAMNEARDAVEGGPETGTRPPGDPGPRPADPLPRRLLE